MKTPDTEKAIRTPAERILILLILAAILTLFALFLRDILIPFLRLELRHDLDGATELLRDRGLQGILTVILVEALQMVVVFIPAEFIQISSGLSYPLLIALVLCDLGVCLGATIIFVLVRVFHFESAAFERRRQRIERLSAGVRDRNTVILLYLLFFMPIIPFGAICYYGSSCGISYRKYIRTAATGVIPSILVSNLMGEAGMAFLTRSLPLWLLVLVIMVLAALLFGLIALFIKRFCFRGADGTPDSLMYAIIFFIVRLWRGTRQNVEIHDEPLRGLQGPYILLANHESFFDFYYISMMAHPRNPDYLVNEFYCTRPVLRHMAREAGILSKRLFTPDLTSGVGILRMLRKGFPVVIFPEGRLSPDGRSNPIVEPGGAFYKRLKVPLVLTRLDGAYYADPKWRPRTYRSDIRVSVERVITPEQLAAMTPAELDKLIAKTLYNDASAAPRSVYRHRDRARGLEGILYRCADCGSLYTTVSRGCELCCTACGRSHFLDERYHFTDDAVSIPAYYDRLRRMEAEALDETTLHAPVRVKIFGAGGGPVRRQTGECFLDRDGFRYRSAAGHAFTVPPERLPALAFSCGKEFELYHGDELYYFYPTEHPQQAARWALYTDLAAQRRREEEDAHE